MARRVTLAVSSPNFWRGPIAATMLRPGRSRDARPTSSRSCLPTSGHQTICLWLKRTPPSRPACVRCASVRPLLQLRFHPVRSRRAHVAGEGAREIRTPGAAGQSPPAQGGRRHLRRHSSERSGDAGRRRARPRPDLAVGRSLRVDAGIHGISAVGPHPRIRPEHERVARAVPHGADQHQERAPREFPVGSPLRHRLSFTTR